MGKKDKDESLWNPEKIVRARQNKVYSPYLAAGFLLRGKLKRTHAEIPEIPALV
jgi:hypothetical protein